MTHVACPLLRALSCSGRPIEQGGWGRFRACDYSEQPGRQGVGRCKHVARQGKDEFKSRENSKVLMQGWNSETGTGAGTGAKQSS